MFWERVAREVGDAPSAFSFLLPDAYLGDEDEARAAERKEAMYSALEGGCLQRTARGLILTERETAAGTRKGILALLDLEEYSPEGEKGASARGTATLLPELVEARLAARRGTLLECPHTVLFYRDKKDKLMRSLEDEQLERLYEFDLMQGGGRLAGSFLPDYIAEDVAHELMSRADPCFAAADGNHFLAGAKAYWDEVKAGLTESERRNHPARFTLAEFVNLADDAVTLEPVHRVVREIETEAFCDWFPRNVRTRREGNVLYPLIGGAEGIAAADAAISAFLRANTGRVSYEQGDPGKLSKGDCVVVAPGCIGKEELLAALKGGKRLPLKPFALGGENEKRYCLECREISYD